MIGKPIEIKDTIEELKKTNATREEAKLVLTNVVQKELFKLRINAEIFHFTQKMEKISPKKSLIFHSTCTQFRN